LDVSSALIDPSNFIPRFSYDGSRRNGVLNDNILNFAGSGYGGHSVAHKRMLTAGQDDESRSYNEALDWHTPSSMQYDA